MTAILILSAINLAVVLAVVLSVVLALYYKTTKKSEVTYTEKDITAFGNYLLSDKRKQSVFSTTRKDEANEAAKSVSHADYENWRYEYKK